MAEDKQIIEGGEDQEDLNSQQTDDTSEEKKVFTLEEVEALKSKMQADGERGAQKLLSQKRVVEQAFEEISNIADDPTRLIELSSESPEVAKLILEKYYGGESIEDYKQRIDYKEDYSDPKVMKSKIREEAERIALENKIDSQKQEFIKKLQMKDEELKAFEESFEELRQLRSFNSKNLTQQLEKAYRLSNDNDEALKKLKTQETIAKTIGTGDGTQTSGKTDSKSKNLKDEISEFKKKHKLS